MYFSLLDNVILSRKILYVYNVLSLSMEQRESLSPWQD